MSLVRTEREKRGLTQTEVARRAQMPRYILNKIEQGTRRLAIEEVARVARAIGCHSSDLIPSPTDEEPAHV